MTKGYVYIFTNEAMPGLVKIGKTTRDPERRAMELRHTGVPCPFKVYTSTFSPDCHDLERVVHLVLAEFRISADREFFRCSAQMADAALLDGHQYQIETWLDEFMPDHRPVYSAEILEMSNTSKLAFVHGVHVFEMVDAYSFLKDDDVAGALVRRAEFNKERGILRPFSSKGGSD